MKKISNAKTKKLAGIIKNAAKTVQEYCDAMKAIDEKIHELELKGTAIVTFNKGEKNSVNSRSLTVLSWYYAQKCAMLNGIKENDVFGDVEDATNASLLTEEISSILLYKKSLATISDLKDEKSDIQHAHIHLSEKLTSLRLKLVKMERGADVLDEV